MSVQIFLQGKLLGIEEFLMAPADRNTDQVFLGRSHWTSLLAEVLPRALLSELGLARILLGIGEGAAFPTATRAMSVWTPTGRWAFAQGITHTFSRVGNWSTALIVSGLSGKIRASSIRARHFGQVGQVITLGGIAEMAAILATRQIARLLCPGRGKITRSAPHSSHDISGEP